MQRGRAFLRICLAPALGQQYQRRTTGPLSDSRPSSPWSLVSFAWRIRASSLCCFPVSSAHLAEICSQKIEMPWACQEGVGWRSYRCFWREIWRIGEIIPEHFCFLKEAPAIPPHCTRFHIHSLTLKTMLWSTDVKTKTQKCNVICLEKPSLWT